MRIFNIDQETYIKILEPEDHTQLFELVDKNRTYLRKWLPWLDHSTKPEDSLDFITMALENFNGNKSFQAGIFYKNNLAGAIGLHEIDWDKEEASIGYWLGEDYQGLGLMTKACIPVLKYAFEELNLKNIEIRCATENDKSNSIPLRLGFRKIDLKKDAENLYGKVVDHFIYQISKEEYNQKYFNR